MKLKIMKRVMSIILCVALLVGYVPLRTLAAEVLLSEQSVAGFVTDPGTAHSWESMMGTEADGNRYAGRVWVDKSIYKDGDTVLLNSRGEAGSSFEVSLQEDEAFQVIFSVLGSTMTTKSTVSSTGPMDVVLVLDTSTSMDDEDSQGVTRLERTITAANRLIDDLLTIPGMRIAIVTYNKDSETVLPLATYDNGLDLVVTNYYNNGRAGAGVVSAYDDDRKLLGKDSGYTSGTNLQSGIDRGFNILANATDIEGRVPVAIVLTDGQANRASQEGFYEIGSHDDTDGTSSSGRNLYLSTLLNAAYTKTKIEANYGKDATVYTVGVDITTNVVARLLMNPADTQNGFATSSNNEIRRAYESFQRWARGETVSYSGWSFDHSYPKQNGVITDAKIAANINYVDTYYDVSSAKLEDTFQMIYEELASGAFNPISSSTSVQGGTGVDDTPLIYVDFIGQHMQIKKLEAVTLFGASYGIVKNADGTYTVAEATGINPATGESWNTARDIRITIIEQADGTQKLEVRINQEILPILLEQVVSETVGKQTTSTITELMQPPLRLFYTVGIDPEILLPNGEVDVSKIQGYSHIDDVGGTVSFYGGQFGVMNPADSNGTVTRGDAHVGFLPSAENRYYYHQTPQKIYTKITDSNGKDVTIAENNEYGIEDNGSYTLTQMTYAEYQSMGDTQKVYTHVTYYRPTASATDASNAAEEVKYLVYTEWQYLKNSVAFYDANAEVYLNDGKAIAEGDVAAAVDAYLQSNPNAELYAVLGTGSQRVSRLHNMTVNKTENATQTAVLGYAPTYLTNQSDHNDNDVAVWLGNNGVLTVQIDTGIALTKSVTEAIGNADDIYKLTVTVPAGVSASPVAVDAEGNAVTSTYSGNVLTVEVKAGQTVYISGIPGGTTCQIGEVVDGDYYIASKTDSVTVPLVSEALNGAAQFAPADVTNAPNKYGNLYITKEITSDHAVPGSVLDTAFEITVNVGAALAGKTFTVEDSAHAAPYDVTVDASGNMIFLIKARQTVEIFRIPEGTAVSVTESTPDSHFAVSYRTRNHSGETADGDNILTIPADGSATAVVMNHYTPSPVSVDLDIAGTKNFTAEGAHPGGTFTYKVQKWNGSLWEDITGKTAETPYAADESGTKTFTIEDVLAGITYSKVGSHAYRVLEVKGNVANVTYDRTLYTFDVTVTDNGGQLVATVTDLHNTAITDGSYEVTFNNTFHTAPVSLDVKKLVNNLSGDTAVSKAGFEFRAVSTDANWNPLTGAEAASFSIFSDAAGNARFTSVCTKVGTYYFLLSEVSKGAPGWTYSAAQYRITVTVTADNGELSAALSVEKTNSTNPDEVVTLDAADATKGTVSFVNTYDPEDISVELDGAVRKELTGKRLEADQFTFYVYADGDRGTPLLIGKNELNGDVNFVDFDKALTFAGVGTYQYDIVESIPDGAVYEASSGKYVLDGMRYDPTIYDLVVEVTNDAATGKLAASYYFEDAVSNVVTFRNHYQATATTYTLTGTKLLHGRAPRDGEFSFELLENGTWKQTATNNADGSFAFKPLTFTEAGVHTYTIREVAGNVAGVRYDGVNQPITVTVTVTDTAGVLSASASVSNADIRFENTYTARSAQVTFNGTKLLKGAALQDKSFTFALYSTDNSFDIAASAATLLGTAENVDGAFSFARSFSTAGTYYFVIVEDASNPVDDVVYDSTEHQFTVRVSDTGDGQLRAVVTNMESGVSTAPAASVSTAVTFTNATFEEVTEKEVYLAGSTATHIDGQKVEAGDILTYFITYTNYTGQNVVADIVDTIPNHTTYVDGSASHGGTYVGSHVGWILNVAKGESVTVSFNVRVNETEAIVANTAVVRDGVNTYKTNEVVNHTVQHELKKDVFAAEDVYTSVDGKKVYEGDELIYNISFINTSGAPANIVITDVIPTNTTYVAGSADNGGVYANGALVWKLENVPAWATVTVAFKVTVNTGIGAATIENQATATDGTNSYETEWVTNYTVKDEAEKQVFAGDSQVKIDGGKVYEGDELTYVIRYKNTAKEPADVTITDTIPAYTTYVDGSADNDGVFANGVITWTRTVPAGETLIVSFKVTVNKDIADKSIENTATIVEGRNTYTTNSVTSYTVDDEVEKNVYLAGNTAISIDGKKVYAGDELVYTISYTNSAKEDATVTIADKIPAHTTYVDGSADYDGVFANGEIKWTKTVPAGETLTVSFRVTVEDAGNATIENVATIVEGKNSYETKAVTNYTTDDEVKKEVFFAADPTVNIDGKKVYAGDELIYAISYTNNDTNMVTVTITDKLPVNTTYVDGSADNGGTYADGTVTWVLDVEAGETVTVTFRAAVADAGNVTIANKATVTEGRNTYTTNEVTNYTVDDDVEKKSFLESDPTVNIDGKKVYIGDTLVYAISYTNGAQETATVTITDTIPAHTAYVDGSADNGGIFADGVLTWELEVEAGQTVTVTFKVTVKDNAKEETISNEATIVEGRNTYTTNGVTNYTVEDEVKKEVFFAADPAVNIDGKKVYAGDELVYAISYTNNDTLPVRVTVTDTIPAHTAYVDGSADNGGVFADGVLTWELDVEAGATVTVTFRVKVGTVGSETITNKATVVEGRNTYTTNETSIYTVEDEVKKEVYLASAPTVNIDGKSVVNGHQLVNVIRYKNTSSEKVTVTITDTIPGGTTYTSESGGTIIDGVISWTLEVEAGEEVAVSFEVTVTCETSMTVTNQAVVVEGRNTYTTNVVSNPATKPDPNDPPATGDYTNLLLMSALMLASCGGLVSTAMVAKKKKETTTH